MAPVAGGAVAVPEAPHFGIDWEESPADVVVTFDLGSGPVSSADVCVRFQRRHLRVSVHGAVACDAELANAVDHTECFWCLEQAPSKSEEATPHRKLVLTLAKAVVEQRWRSLWKAEAEEAEEAEVPARSVVIGSSWDLGDEDRHEDVEEQRQRERELEPRYLELVRKKGLEDEETLSAFFSLFAEKIQLYKLTELDEYLKDIVPVCRRRTDSFRIEALQALAAVRFKQRKVQEGLDLLLELERFIGVTNSALEENIAYGYHESKDFESAEKRYRRSLRLTEAEGKPARGCTLLGLGICYQSMGRLKEALEVLQKANAYYVNIAAGRPSSLQAKCGVSLARVYYELGELELAVEYMREAVSAYEVTCGKDSPLVAQALSLLGPALLELGRANEAKAAFKRAYELEVIKDAVDFDALVKNHLHLMLSHTHGTTVVDRTEFRDYFGLVDQAVARARSLEQAPAELLPSLLKLAAEVKAYGADYEGAVRLLEEAIPRFQELVEDARTTVNGLAFCRKLMSLCKLCFIGARTPPMRLSTEDTEYAMLLPPTQKEVQQFSSRRAEENAAAERAMQASADTASADKASADKASADTASAPWEGPIIEELPDDLPGDVRGSGASSSSGGPGREVPRATPSTRCRELQEEDFATLDRLWKATGAERLFTSEDLLSRHLEANKGLSFAAERGGEVIGFSIAGAAGPFGLVRQVLAGTRNLLARSPPVSPLVLGLEHEARSLLLDRTAAALRTAGCTSVEVLVPAGESQEFWERRAPGPARSAFAV